MGAENLGVEYLAAIARAAGHEADLAFDPAVFSGNLMWDIPALAAKFDLRPKIIKRIETEKPDAVAFSCFTGNYLWALSIAREIKKTDPEIRALFGGVHVTAVPELVIAEDAVDVVTVGEADSVFVDVLERRYGTGNGGAPAGVWYKTAEGIRRGPESALPVDLDALPHPAKDIFYKRVPSLQSHYMIMTARGCPYNCTYCYKSLSVYSQPGIKPIRRRSVENVINELEQAVLKWKVKMTVFRDDVFTLQKKWLCEFTEEYRRKINLPYFCYTHPAALDAESADLIKEGGCRFVTIGIQSADEEQRRNILNRNYTNDQVRKTVSLLKERKITVSVDHIIGLPGDTEEKLRSAVAFYNELRPDRLLTFWLTYYPGAEIMNIARESGILDDKDCKRIESGHGGHRYSGGGAKNIQSDMLRLPLLFALVPMLNPRIINWLLKKRFEKHFPPSFSFHNILLFLNAVRTRDPFFFYNIKYSLSKKRVP